MLELGSKKKSEDRSWSNLDPINIESDLDQ